jgi:hypothetical protein
MMFFKLASLQYSSYYAAINTIQSYNLNDHSILPNNFSSMKMNLAYMFKIPEVLSDSKQSIAEKKILSTNPTNELFRHLWQQDIFLSINRKSLYKYNLDISSVNISKYQKRQKSLLSKFSKALFSGSIQCALTSSLNVSKKSSVSVNYSWSKVLKIQVLKTQNLYANSNYLNNLQDVFYNKINAKYLPVFAISNHLGQMIMAEPSRNFYSAQHVNDLGPVIKKMYHGFFFINYEDAKEYLEYVQSTYNLKNESLKIFTCNLNTFYNIMGASSKEISFRLIPDLSEISSLIKESRYKRYLMFHKKQKKNRASFQGQPLYFVKYSNGYLNHVVSNKKYILLFTHYDEALKIANRLQYNHSESSLQRPQVLVYNLEKFINDQLNQHNKSKDSFLIIPSKSSYLFTKKYHLYSNNQLVCGKCLESLSFINLWIKRIFWSLTSRKPV